MKKVFSLIIVIVILFAMTLSVLAGDIISPLMEDDAQLYFGELRNYTENEIVFIQNKNIKGEFEQDKEYTFEKFDVATKNDLEKGKIYLITDFNDGENVIIWETTSTDTKTLEVIGDHPFADVIEIYLNDGTFEKAEQERLEKINKPDTSSTSVVGGSDEPTNIIVKSNFNPWLVVGISVILLILVVFFVVKKNKNK